MTAPASKPPLAERVDDLTDIELAARAVDTEFDWWSCDDAGPQHMDPADARFIALANPARLLALVAELRGLRARNADLEKHAAWRATMDDGREEKEWT